MGGLHHGHGQLIKTAQSAGLNDQAVVIVSIFINPLQFGPKEDFENYPRDLENDIEIASKFGASAIWIPSQSQVFPGGPDSSFTIQVPPGLKSKLCGSIRKGHFDGVATVIIHLLRRVQPHILVLGEKDWQQFVILRELIEVLGLPVKVRGVATVRDIDGLAHSSRNQYLNEADRAKALALPKEITKAAQDAKKGKIVDLHQIRTSLENKGLEVEYVEIVDPEKLQSTKSQQHFSLLAAAVRCGTTRLIDHTFLMSRNPIVAIDGPAGAGKSTVTRAFAKKMGLLYLDTGAMYRAVTWLIQKNKISPKDQVAIGELVKKLKLEIKSFGNNQQIIVNGNDVTNAIRSPIVTSLVSEVAAQSLVRKALTEQQKAMGNSGGLVAEGRDIGTAVFPNAELKIFLTASTAERARRRSIDLKEKGYTFPTLNELESQIKERDKMDSTRSISPLVKAQDANELITDGMSVEKVIESIEELFRMRIPEEVWPTPLH